MPRYEGTDHNHAAYKKSIADIIGTRPLPEKQDEKQSTTEPVPPKDENGQS